MLETIPQSLEWAHPVVREWFISRFKNPTKPQEEGWPRIALGESVLIAAPTGSGKTLSAFLACIDTLVRKSIAGELDQKTEVVYVSPLKALSNDIQKNLEGPLKEILALAESKGYEIKGIKTSVRTGDTSQSERQSMLRKPPHILVTTPESLYILLTADKSREMLKTVSTVIVDEIHAIADDKRGTHLSLTLERLEELSAEKPVRIGLSATQKPIEEIARFLAGNRRPLPKIIDSGSRRKLDVSIEVPKNNELGAVTSSKHWDDIYNRIIQLAEEHKSTLVFVNTRRLAERIAFILTERLGEEVVGTHHGSLSKKLRLEAEQKLKAGEYKILVATASLELGIDIGDVDLVCQIGSARSIATALQRIGRSGHWLGAIPKGRIFATTRDDLIECAALAEAIYDGDLDKLTVLEKPIDILAQQIVAICSVGDWQEDDLYELIVNAYPYRNLSRKEFDEVLAMLSEGIAGRYYSYGRYLHRDSVNKRVRGRRGAKLYAITNGGAIPEKNVFTVYAQPGEVKVGTLDEDFAVEVSRGDIILLGNTSWRIKRVEGMASVVHVEDAKGEAPTVPFWLGESPGRTTELSDYVSKIRETVNQSIKDENTESALNHLTNECKLNNFAADQIVQYIKTGKGVLGEVPTNKRVIIERFFDMNGSMQLVVHAPFGARINKAWGLALRKRFCKSFNIELQASATDDGINISLSGHHSFPLEDVFQFVSINTAMDVLEQTGLTSPIFTTRWRWDSNRALALLKFQGGKKVPPLIQKMRAEDMLIAVFPKAAACQDNIVGPIEIPDHPLVNEVMKDVLTEAMDSEGFIEILKQINDGSIECLHRDTPEASEFSRELVNVNPYAFLDDAPLEERRARAVQMRHVLPEGVIQDAGFLSQEAIKKITREAIPDIRNRDELSDLLKSLIVLPESYQFANGESAKTMWSEHFDTLESEGRAFKDTTNGTIKWVAHEHEDYYEHLLTDEECMDAHLSGWLLTTGPTTVNSFAEKLELPESLVHQSLLRLEDKGRILRGKFRGFEEEWCERVLLSRIHKETIAELQKQIQPVSKYEFMDWLFSWHHLTPLTQLYGDYGVQTIINQLEGYEIAASAWEEHILPARIQSYNTESLDNLTLKGTIGWGRLSLHPAIVRSMEALSNESQTPVKQRRIAPTSVSPIAFYDRAKTDWAIFRQEKADISCLNTTTKKVFECLEQYGASFFLDIVRKTKLLKAEVETALWELVTAGLVTADHFDNLRSLINPKRRAGLGRYKRKSRPRDAQGRWSLLDAESLEEIHDTNIETICWILLRRYGVVFRDILARESNLPQWRDILYMFRRLEAQGQIRGGRFVSGFHGEQYALPEAVESIRSSGSYDNVTGYHHFKSKHHDKPTTMISSYDPLNLVGIIVPGEKIATNSNKKIVFKEGKVIDILDEKGVRPLF